MCQPYSSEGGTLLKLFVFTLGPVITRYQVEGSSAYLLTLIKSESWMMVCCGLQKDRTPAFFKSQQYASITESIEEYEMLL
jgi:hypothetical protein